MNRMESTLKKLHLYEPAVVVARSFSIIAYLLFRKKLFEVNQGQYWSDRSKKFDKETEQADDAYYAAYNKALLDRIYALPETRSILELGCYYCYRLSKIKKEFPDKSIVGCDIGKEQLMICRQHFIDSGVLLVNCSGAKLPFKENSFDLVFTSACLQHVPYDAIDRVIGEISRVAGKHILLIEAYLNHMSLRKKIQYLGIDYFYMHDYEKILKKHGLKKIEAKGLTDENNHNRYSLFLYSK